MTRPRAMVHVLYGFFFLMGAETYVVNPLIPTIGRAMRVDAPAAAITVTAFVIAYAISAPLVAAVATPRRRPWLVIAGTVMFAVGNLACGVAWTFDVMIAGRVLAGVGAGLAAPSVWTLLSAMVSDDQRGRVVGYGVAAYGAGQVLGVPLGAFLAEVVSWRLAFVAIAAGFTVLIPPLVVLLRRRYQSSGSHTPAADQSAPQLRYAVFGALVLALLATFFVQAGRLGAYSFVSSIAEMRYSSTTNDQGLIGLAAGLGAIGGSITAGRLCDYLTRHTRSALWASMGFALIFMAFAIVSFATRSPILFLVTLVGWCVAGGGFYSAQQVFFSSQSDTIRQSAIAWNGTVMNIGIAAGTTLLGHFALGGTVFIVAMAGLATVGIVMLGASLAVYARSRNPVPDPLVAVR
ncbi:MFS transporter [Gordonia sp. CPCC 205333]|uniref:MFS transporter n=1 Tax=Gordonia sp. CPCC 205333 TaxID=3140790 RepID=UPI003AF352F9